MDTLLIVLIVLTCAVSLGGMIGLFLLGSTSGALAVGVLGLAASAIGASLTD